MRVLHLIDSISVAGAEKLLCNTISELTEYEHLVVSVFSDNNPSLLPSGVQYKSLQARGKAHVFLKGFKYKNIVKQFRPDLVHSHLYFATVLAKCFTPKNIPFVFTQHFEFSKNADKWYYAIIDRAFSTSRQTCIAVAEGVKRDYIKSTKFKGSTFVVNNYVTDNFFERYATKQTSNHPLLKMVSVGNIKPIKNQQYLIDAFRYLKDLPVSCDVYGEGQNKGFLADIVQKEGLNVNFKGLVEDVSWVLPSYDLYIMPSLTEGFPLALFEAMACGLPVIVSDIPIFRELLENQGNYVSLEDPSRLRAVVEKFLNSPALLSSEGYQMQRMANAKAGKEKYLSAIQGLYNDIIKTKKLFF